MRITNLGRASALLSIFTCSAIGGVGCGGGGGGSGTPTIPGTLAAIAVQGASAPGTGAGVYGAFSTTAKFAVANGGWTAFIADVTGSVTTTKGVFVVEPGGTVRLVYAVNDLLPDSNPGTGIILDFERVFVTSGGVVVALVTGNVPGEGIVAARDNGTSIVEKHGVIYTGVILPTGRQSQVPGALTDIDPNLLAVDNQGSSFFLGVGTGLTPLKGIYAVNRAGGGLTHVVMANDDYDNGGGLVGYNFDGLGIDEDGLVLACSVDITGAPSAKGLFVADASFLRLIEGTGNQPPNVGARTFADIHPSGPLQVSYDSGSNSGFLTWCSSLSGGSPDLGVFARQIEPSLGSLTTLLGPGDSATAAGAGAGAVFADVTLVSSQQDPNRITIDAQVAGGTTDQIFFSSPGPGSLSEIWRQGQIAPGGSTFQNAYPSLATAGTSATDIDGSPAFVATLADATSGLFWAIRSNGFYSVAKEGDVAPGTGRGLSPFGSPSVVSTATNVVVFRAAITLGTTASGLFRQN